MLAKGYDPWYSSAVMEDHERPDDKAADHQAPAEQKLPGVGSYIREQRRRAGVSLRALADRAGVSNPYLSQVERGLRRPSAKVLQGIAKALRVSAVTLYAQAGILEDASGETNVLRAIFSDRGLTDGQKRELAELYERFRIETAERRSRRQGDRLKVAGGED